MTSYYKTKIKGTNQNTVPEKKLVYNSEGGKPTFVNRPFLVTLFISSNEPSKSSEC